MLLNLKSTNKGKNKTQTIFRFYIRDFVDVKAKDISSARDKVKKIRPNSTLDTLVNSGEPIKSWDEETKTWSDGYEQKLV